MFLRSRLAQVTIAAAVFLILGSILPPLYNNQSRPLPRDLNLEIHAEHDGATFTRHTTTAPAMKDSVARAQSTTDLTLNGETIAHITEESQLNRESTYPVAGPNTTQHIELPAFDVQVEDRVERDGISYFFPSGAEQRSYPFFDPLTQDTEPIDFLRDEKLDSIPTYVFHQDVAPVSLGEIFAFDAHRSGPAGDFTPRSPWSATTSSRNRTSSSSLSTP
ncbi:porin PorA family protein [Corynebacterium guaraldiae]|uniref:porin PorA family protein n=1 Tax=Corynebacterium guaraldiae TaxID=3051103 RepID=UPI0032AF84F0